jgi:hypothetical protein
MNALYKTKPNNISLNFKSRSDALEWLRTNGFVIGRWAHLNQWPDYWNGPESVVELVEENDEIYVKDAAWRH